MQKAVIFPNADQCQILRVIMRVGLRETWPKWATKDKENMKSALHRLDYFCEETGRPLNPSFCSILEVTEVAMRE